MPQSLQARRESLLEDPDRLLFTHRSCYRTKHLKVLESMGFIRREKRFREGVQTSNYFIFLWHRIFDE